MGATEAIALAGAATLALGGLIAAWPGAWGRAVVVQGAGVALLGGAGASLLARDSSIGAGFSSDVAPAFGLDALSGFFLLVLAASALPALAFARSYVAAGPSARALGSLGAAFLLTLTGLLAARDIVTFLAFWELMTLIPAAAILVARRDAPVRGAVFTYVAITHLGGAGVWIALLVAAGYGAIGDPAALAAHGTGAQTLVAVAALIGFGTKAGLVPLHSWLPKAHPVAPAHLSALMSGVLIKVALYGLIRVEFEWLGATPRWLGLTLLGLGLVSALGGILWALVQRDLKGLLAFSSVENVGIVTLALGASMLFADAGSPDWAAIAFGAALLQILSHALLKSLMFLAAGAMERATGSLELDRLGGLLRRMPWTGTAFLVGAAGLAGLPPLSGFASEWLTLQSLLHVALDAPIGIALAAALATAGLAATAALALLCFVKVAGLVLLGSPRREECLAATDPAPGMRAGVAALAVMCAVLGLVPGLLLPALTELAPGAGNAVPAGHAGLSIPGTGSLPTLALALGLVALTAVLARARGSRRAATAPTWACGQRVVPELSWTSAAFTKPLRLVLERLLRPERELEVISDAGQVRLIRYSSSVPSLVDTALMEPATRTGLRGAAFVRRLQTGNVRTYALYLLALVVAALALVQTGWIG